MKNLNQEIISELNGILPCKTRFLRKACRKQTFGHCVPSFGNVIYLRLKMAKFEYLEVTWVHEWMHLYHASLDPRYKNSKMKKRPPISNPPEGVGCAHLSQAEEECEAFALLMVGQSKDYDLEDLTTKLWLHKMWFVFWDKYPALQPILLTHSHRPSLLT